LNYLNTDILGVEGVWWTSIRSSGAEGILPPKYFEYYSKVSLECHFAAFCGQDFVHEACEEQRNMLAILIDRMDGELLRRNYPTLSACPKYYPNSLVKGTCSFTRIETND
jgi:hypothetical protein